MSRRALVLVGALVTFCAVVLGIAAWAALSGNAGSQRGLVIRNTLDEDVTVTLGDGQRAVIGPSAREHTFVVRREDFPSVIRVERGDGAALVERPVEYREFVDAEFRLSIDARGIYPTNLLRERPTATP